MIRFLVVILGLVLSLPRIIFDINWDPNLVEFTGACQLRFSICNSPMEEFTLDFEEASIRVDVSSDEYIDLPFIEVDLVAPDGRALFGTGVLSFETLVPESGDVILPIMDIALQPRYESSLAP